MFRFHRVIFGLLPIVILLAACAAPASTNTSSVLDATSAAPVQPAAASEQTQPAAQPGQSLTAQPVQAAAQPSQQPTAQATKPAAQALQPTAQPTQAQAAQPAAQPSSGNYRLVIVPDGTEARFRVKEQLVGNNLPNDAVGTTKAVTGAIVISPSGALVPGESRIVADISTLRTDQPMRDNFIKQSTLQVSQYPKAEFVPTAVQGLASPLPTNGDVTFQITGDMTVHGVTKPATWQVTAKIAGKDMTGTATAAFKFADFNMSQPKVARVLSVEDNIHLELDFHLVAQ